MIGKYSIPMRTQGKVRKAQRSPMVGGFQGMLPDDRWPGWSPDGQDEIGQTRRKRVDHGAGKDRMGRGTEVGEKDQ